MIVSWSGPLLPLLSLMAPLLLALCVAHPAARPHAPFVLPFAPLPALLLALVGERGPETVAFDLLLGVHLGLDGTTPLYVGAAAALWALAGLYATAYIKSARKPATFVAFWCLTLTGNLGVFLARDAVTFYASFTAVSLPAYILIVHAATLNALRAGRIYMILAILGETALLAALLLGVAEAGSIMIADVKAAVAASSDRFHIALLLVVAFGIKAGLVPLHMWLPLAHPEAPTPASAVLSGAIVNAGIIGLVAFLPAGAGMTIISMGLVVAGMLGAFYAVLIGLLQSNPKVILAYSTVSQMGLVIAAVGASLVSSNPAAAQAAIALYCVHHGLAKGALFLSVGVIDHTARDRRPLIIALVAFAALSVAGLPLTGGAVAKTALKEGFEGVSSLAVTLSATGTALLLVHFLRVLREVPYQGQKGYWRLTMPLIACVIGAVVVPWALLTGTGVTPGDVASIPKMWSGLWPLLLAAAIFPVWGLVRRALPNVPPGDLIVLAERVWLPRLPSSASGIGWRARSLTTLDPERLEAILIQWQVAGGLLLVIAIAGAVALA